MADESKSGFSLSIDIPTESAVKLEVEEVRKVLEESKESNIAIIDVRGADYAGGHIAGSVNVPYDKFAEQLDALVAKYKDTDRVIFHCMYSEQRGPHCANTFLNRRKELFPSAEPNSYVLLGGFQKWLQTYYDDEAAMKSVVEDFDADSWVLDKFGRRVHASLV